MNGILMD